MSWLLWGSSQKLTGAYPGGQKLFRCTFSMDAIDIESPSSKWQTSGNVSWAMEVTKIKKEGDSEKEDLKVIVKCQLEHFMESYVEDKWHIEADHIVRLINHKDSEKNLCSRGSSGFNKKKGDSEPGSIHITDLSDDFLLNDEFTFEVEIGVKSSEGLPKAADFSVKSPSSNVIITIGKEKLYVDKKILSKKSSVFEEMFSKEGVGKDKNEYPVTDVEPAVFHMFIKFVSDAPIQFSLDHIEELSKMSEKFNIAEFKDKCTDFLMNSVVDDAVALKYADKFGMQNVIVEKLKALNTIPDLKKAFKHYRRFSDESMRLLLKKLIEVA